MDLFEFRYTHVWSSGYENIIIFERYTTNDCTKSSHSRRESFDDHQDAAVIWITVERSFCDPEWDMNTTYDRALRVKATDNMTFALFCNVICV